MKKLSPDVREAVACITFGGGVPGFALPLFRDDGLTPRYLVQEIDEITNRIAAFRVITGALGPLISVENGVAARVGAPPVYAFVNEQGVAYIDVLDRLKTHLMSFVAKFPANVSVKFQVAELLGSIEQKRSSRLEMREAIRRRTGDAAASHFYEESLLTASLWDRIIAKAPNGTVARRILQRRSRISAVVKPDTSIALELDALGPSDYSSAEVAKIAEDMRVEFGLVPHDRVKPSGVAKEYWLEVAARERVSARDAVGMSLERIGRATQQEERISLLLAAVLESRAIGYRLLKEYKSDRAKYATLARNLLLEALETERGGGAQKQFFAGSSRHGDRQLAEIVWRSYSVGMPANRALLFYYMAKYLAKYPDVNVFLRRKLSRSSSVFLEPYLNEIRIYLDAPTTPMLFEAVGVFDSSTPRNDEFLALVNASSSGAVLKVAEGVEMALNAAASRLGIYVAPGRSPLYLAVRMQKDGLINERAREMLDDITHVRNEVVHGAPITRERVMEFANLAASVISELEAIGD